MSTFTAAHFLLLAQTERLVTGAIAVPKGVSGEAELKVNAGNSDVANRPLSASGFKDRVGDAFADETGRVQLFDFITDEVDSRQFKVRYSVERLDSAAPLTSCPF